MGFLTIGILIPFLKSLIPKLIENWTDAITHRNPKVEEAKPTSRTKPIEPKVRGGKLHLDNTADFEEWRKSNNVNIKEGAHK